MLRQVAVVAVVSAAAVLTLLLIFGAQVAPATAQDRPISIAVVDLERVVTMSAAGRDLQARLAQFQKDVQAQANELSGNAREIRQRIAEGANSLTDAKLDELQKKYEAATISIRRFQDDKQREGRKMQTEGLRDIERELEPVFKKLQDEQSYDLILNNVAGVVVMAAERVDITDLVIKAFDAGE